MARKRKTDTGDAAAEERPRVLELPGGDVVLDEPDERDWSHFGTDRDGLNYDVCRNTDERRVRSGDANPAQAAWLEGGEWDMDADISAAYRVAAREQRREERAAADGEAG